VNERGVALGLAGLEAFQSDIEGKGKIGEALTFPGDHLRITAHPRPLGSLSDTFLQPRGEPGSNGFGIKLLAHFDGQDHVCMGAKTGIQTKIGLNGTQIGAVLCLELLHALLKILQFGLNARQLLLALIQLPFQHWKTLLQSSLPTLEHLPALKKALRIFADHGAEVDWDSKIVRIPPDLVDRAMATAPRTITLGGREPRFDLILDGSCSYLTTDS
jgi:hypothetical protein